MRAIPSLLAALVMLAACTVPPSYTYYGAPIATSRRVENLRNVASRYTACPARDIEVRPLTTQVFQTLGCGRVREFAIVDRGVYAEWEPIATVHTRASNEMVCPVDQLVVAAPIESARDVSGCGRSAQYQLACSARHCEWLMTSHSGDWANRPSVVVSPAPSGTPAPATPDTQRAAVERGIADALDGRRERLRACVPDGTSPVVRARWGTEGRVMISVDPPWSGTAVERCVQNATGLLRVTTGVPGEMVHVVR